MKCQKLPESDSFTLKIKNNILRSPHSVIPFSFLRRKTLDVMEFSE